MASVLDNCSGLAVRELAAGEDLMVEGAPCDGILYILADGAMEIRKGDVQIAIIDEKGAFFGEMSLLLDQPVSATVRALEPSRFHVAPAGAPFLDENTGVALAVARTLARRLHMASTYLADLKGQFEDATGSLNMIDEVIDALTHHQAGEEDCKPGSDRDPNY